MFYYYGYDSDSNNSTYWDMFPQGAEYSSSPVIPVGYGAS